MRLLLCLSLTALLSGCATTWYKEGATQSDFEHDKALCTVNAYRRFPVSNVSTAVGQATTTPILTSCQNSFGTTNCTTTGGQVQPAPTITRDANAGARGAAFDACMYEQGYSTVAPAAAAPSASATIAADHPLSKERYPAIGAQSPEHYPPIETAANSKNAATPGKQTAELPVVGVCEKLVVGGKDLTKQCANSLLRTTYPNGWNAIRVETKSGEPVQFSTRPEVVVSPELSTFDVETLGINSGKGQGVTFVEARGRCQIQQGQADKKLTCEMQAAKEGRTIVLSFRFSR